MRLWRDPPGIDLEPGWYTALVARPGLDRSATLYLDGAVSPGAAAFRQCRPVRRTLFGAGPG